MGSCDVDKKAQTCSDLRVSSFAGAATARMQTLPRLRPVHRDVFSGKAVPVKTVWPNACMAAVGTVQI